MTTTPTAAAWLAALAACSVPSTHFTGAVDADGPIDALLQAAIYANTASTLYRVDPNSDAITQVGDFGWPASVGTDQMTDLAIDRSGTMIGTSFSAVFRVDPVTAQCTLLFAGLTEGFNGLSFVPAAMLGETGEDVLVGTRSADGYVFRFDLTTGARTMIGDMGAGFSSSGDLVAVAGFGIAQTVVGPTHDRLAMLASQTFTASPIGGDTGFDQIWGVAFWNGKLFGFTNTGDFILIDPTTGSATLVASLAVSWWGAAVTTVAPVGP